MFKEIVCFAEDKLKKSIVTLKTEFSKLILNKANLKLLDDVSIIYYGEKYRLDQLSVMMIESANIASIKPFDKKNLSLICKEIVDLKMDLNPFVVGDIIKVSFPKLTSERRDLFVKKMKKHGEDTKISMRNIRRLANQKIKILLKDGELSKDDERKVLLEIQNLVDKYIGIVDEMVEKKEAELLKV